MRAGRALDLSLAHMPVSREAVNDDVVTRAVRDPERLAMVESIGLLDTVTEEPYDRISRIASRVMSAPIATVTLIDRDRQFYKACVGIPEPLSTSRIPLELAVDRVSVRTATQPARPGSSLANRAHRARAE